MGVHDGWARKARDLGVAYQVTGQSVYAEKAREILMAYVAAYATYELHTVRGETKIGGGRVGPQTLDESVWLIPFCQGADLVWDALSVDEQTRLANELLLVSAREVILPHEMKVHNIQCWKNSAVGLVGFLLGDDELIAQAIDHPERGYHKQMADGVTPDGQWWEGAWGYHFYTLSALWSLVEAARNCGVDLYGDAFKRMFDAPLVFAMPSLKLPAFNDSGEVDLAGRMDIFEIAQAQYQNPDYAFLLGQGKRESDFALWFGDGEIAASEERSWQSANLPESGYAILSQGTGGNATWLCFKYGPHGGGHGHPDKLNFILASKGEVVGYDPGTTRYGLPAQSGWYKTSLAHNVLVVDETSQASAEGQCLDFGQCAGVDYCVANAGEIYEGVHHVRSVALVDENLVLVVDQITSDSERMLDLVYHHRGQWQSVPDGEVWASPDVPGYQYLQETTSRLLDGATLAGDGAIITLAKGDMTEVITGTGMGDNQEDRVPVVIFRRRAKKTTCVWAISLNATPVSISANTSDDGNTKVHLTREDSEWTLQVNPSQEEVFSVSS
jgi:hypothetical protein